MTMAFTEQGVAMISGILNTNPNQILAEAI
jgi:hypothetical protein